MTNQQRTPEWFAARRGYLTASNCGAVLGYDPNRTADDVMRAMVREWHHAESEFKGNIATDYGTAMEAIALSCLQFEHGLEVKPAFFETMDGWLGASPDGYSQKKTIIEIKCPFGLRDKNPPVFKSIYEQPHYYAQVQVQLLVTGRLFCTFYQYAPHGDNIEYVKIDESWREQNIPILKKFYDEYLVQRDNPAVHLAPLRKEINTARAKAMLAEYDQLTEAMDNAKARIEEIKAEFIEMSGGRDALIHGRKLTQTERKGSVDWKTVWDIYGDKTVNVNDHRGKTTTSWRLG